jgi:PTH2 family peptidyl-tRNA hydrolase
MDTVKQVIVIRTDTDPPMRKGKMVAQGSHASIAFLVRNITQSNKLNLSKAEIEWLASGQTKICVRVDSEEDLHKVHAAAKAAGLESNLIKDSGKTEFKEPTYTCLAIGPDHSSKIDQITGHLKLL